MNTQPITKQRSRTIRQRIAKPRQIFRTRMTTLDGVHWFTVEVPVERKQFK